MVIKLAHQRKTYYVWMFVVGDCEAITDCAAVSVATMCRIKQHCDHVFLIDVKV